MKKNIKGFTLVELLAVIVILGLIMTIAGTSLISTRKEANKEEAKNIENTITKVGEELYAHESMLGIKDFESYCKKNEGVWDTDSRSCKDKDGALMDDISDNYFYKKYNKASKDESLNITIEALKNAGYLKSSTISNPSGNGDCKGYLKVTKTSSGPKFKGYVCCPNLYETGKSKEPTSCSSSITNEAFLTNN